MPAIVLDLLKFVFLAVLYIFVARAVRAVYLELRGSPSRPRLASAPAPARPPPRKAKKAPRKLAIVEGDEKGKSIPLGDEIIIGRAEKCHLVLEDDYVSQVHARIFARNDSFLIEDMGSTNGTYLNRRRITAPAELRRGDHVKVGRTVLEMRR